MPDQVIKERDAAETAPISAGLNEDRVVLATGLAVETQAPDDGVPQKAIGALALSTGLPLETRLEFYGHHHKVPQPNRARFHARHSGR